MNFSKFPSPETRFIPGNKSGFFLPFAILIMNETWVPSVEWKHPGSTCTELLVALNHLKGMLIAEYDIHKVILHLSTLNDRVLICTMLWITLNHLRPVLKINHLLLLNSIILLDNAQFHNVDTILSLLRWEILDYPRYTYLIWVREIMISSSKLRAIIRPEFYSTALYTALLRISCGKKFMNTHYTYTI